MDIKVVWFDSHDESTFRSQRTLQYMFLTQAGLPVVSGFTADLTPLTKSLVSAFSRLPDLTHTKQLALLREQRAQTYEMPDTLSQALTTLNKQACTFTIALLTAEARIVATHELTFSVAQLRKPNIILTKLLTSLLDLRLLHELIYSPTVTARLHLELTVHELPAATLSGTVETGIRQGHSRQNEVVIYHGGSVPLHTSKQIGDHYRVDMETFQIVSRDRNKQNWHVTGTGKHERLTYSKRVESKLPDSQLIALAKRATQVESVLGLPCIMHWIYDSNDALHIVKVTTGSSPAVSTSTAPLLQGKSLSSGFATGPVRLIHKKADLASLQQEDIAVAQTLSMFRTLPDVRGIVSESGQGKEAIVSEAKDQGIPIIVGATPAFHQLTEGMLVTLNGQTGAIHQGSLPITQLAGQSSTSSDIITGTRILAAGPSSAGDGAYLSLQDLLQQKSTRKETIASLMTGLTQLAQALYPRPLYLSLSDLENPAEFLGTRGAKRHLANPAILDMELEAIRKGREEYGASNVHLMLPFVRTFEEFTTLRHMITGAGLRQSREFRLGLICQTPSSVLQIGKFCHDGQIQQVVIDLDHLTQLTLGTKSLDPNTATDESVLMSIAHVARACHEHATPVMVTGTDLANQPETLEFCIHAGVTGVIVPEESIDQTRHLVASIEQHVLLDHAISELEER